MHLSVILFAMIVSVMSLFVFCKARYRDKELTIKKAYSKHEMLFEMTIIFGVFAGILIDLLIGNSLLTKLIADFILIPIVAFVFIKPFLFTDDTK